MSVRGADNCAECVPTMAVLDFDVIRIQTFILNIIILDGVQLWFLREIKNI